VGSVRYGIEPGGANTIVSNNVVTGANRGLLISGNTNYDNMTITGNNFTANVQGLSLEIGVTGSGKNIVVFGNYIKAPSGIVATRDTTNLTISGNVIVGPDPTFNLGNGIFLDTPPEDAYVFITGNTIIDVASPYLIFSNAATTFNYLFATNNNLSLAGLNTNSSRWTAVGSAVIGTTVISANNVNPAAIGLQYSIIDQGANIRVEYGTGTPEASITANVGSLFINKSGGAGTTLYVKQSGTGNTGWAGLS
jgi:hypothetical protein